MSTPSLRSAPRLLTVAALALLVVACTGSRRSEDLLAANVETDFATIADDAYVAATRRLNRYVGYEFTALPGARGYGIRDVIALADGGHLLLAVEPGDGVERLLLVEGRPGGGVAARHEVAFAAGSVLSELQVVDLSGIEVPVLSLRIGQVVGVDRVYFAITADGPVALRAEFDGAVANTALHRHHPQVPVARGSLGSGSRLQRLAATVALADPAMAAERGRPAARSHLEQMAAGNDVWLAQAAANLLTMRVE